MILGNFWFIWVAECLNTFEMMSDDAVLRSRDRYFEKQIKFN